MNKGIVLIRIIRMIGEEIYNYIDENNQDDLILSNTYVLII